jgi:CTP synthase
VERPAPLFVHFIAAAKEYAEIKINNAKLAEEKIAHQ